MSSLVRFSCAMAAALALSLAFTASQKAHAATFTVNSTGDTLDAAPGNGACADSLGNCTLRSALDEANSLAGNDTINFSVTGTINLTGALPDIISNITINGPGSSLLTVRRNTGGDYRIFFTDNVSVNISGLTLTNGKTANGVSGVTKGDNGLDGGCILQDGGVMTLTDVIITGNRTGNGGSATGGSNSFGGWGGFGGGIMSSGVLTMVNCVVSNNSTGSGATGGSGGSGGRGGGIFFAPGTLTLTNVSITGNRTGNGGTGINGGLSGGNSGYGGGIWSGLTFGNQTTTLNMTNVNISNNSTGNVVRADAGSGGGIYISSGTATLTNSTVGNNHTGTGDSSSAGGSGGGIYNVGTLTVRDSTISGNATGNSFSNGRTTGGGISNSFVLNLINSTISNNSTGSGYSSGGGISSGATLTLANCTVTGNSAFNNVGNGIVGGNITYVRNTIIAGNGSAANSPDASGTFKTQGYNLIGVSDGSTGFTGTGDQAGTAAAPLNAQLGPLADNGGPTLTHALLATSPALDAGNNLLAKDANNKILTSDQRGAGRFANSANTGAPAVVDIGAFELHISLEDVSDKTTNEDTPLLIPFSVGDGVADISSVTATSDNQTLVPNANLSITGGPVRTLQVIPAANQFGTATITLTVTHTSGPAESDTFLITVKAVNDSPVFTKGADQTTGEDSGPRTVANWATGIGVGPNESGQTLSFIVTGNTNPGLFTAEPSVNSSGTLTYTPAKNANGSATITLVLKDNGGTASGGQDTSAAQTFVVNVTPVNDAPVANKQTITAYEDSPYMVILTGSDAEGSSLNYVVVSGPAHGTLTGTGAFRTYTSTNNYSGPDSFTFKVNDGLADSANATVFITVNAVNDAPVNSVPGMQTIEKNTTRVFSAANSNAITISDVDAGANPLRVSLSASNATLTLGKTTGLTFATGDGTGDATMTFTGTIASINAALNGLAFKPDTNFNGMTGFQITTNDQGHSGSGGIRTDNDFLTVMVLDDRPILLADESTGRAIALDLVTQTRDPFTLSNPFNLSTDHRRRVSLFVWRLGLLPGDNASAVTVQAVDSDGGLYFPAVEYVGAVPNLPSVTQVVIRLPEQVANTPRDLWVTVSLRGKTSSGAFLWIAGP